MLKVLLEYSFILKLQPCIVSTQITNTELFTFIVVLVFKLLSRKVWLYKITETVKKVRYFLRK